jgi:hypothetical protein
MAGKVTITDTDRGYKALMARLYKASGGPPSVRVGILAQDADTAYVRKADRAANTNSVESAVTLLQVAIFNEFGTSRIPARSFLRAWVDENEETIREKFFILMKSVVKGERTKEQILDLIGLWAVGQIQERISAGIEPGNAQSTIDRKGSSKPLIDTGLLRSSISHMVDA